MYECNYSREPVNFRLLGLRILKKFWMIPASFFAGAVLVFGVYFLYKTVITGRTYQVTNIYYIDFAEDSSGTVYTWVNQYTWSALSDMDVFIDGIYDELSQSVSKEDLRNYSDCTVESDGRYLYMRITTPSPELSMRVATAYEKTLFAFCNEHKEFNSITKEHAGEAVDNSNIRVKEVSILGGICGLLILLVIMLSLDTVDTSLYIPATIEYRYHVKTLGAPSMKEFEENCSYLLNTEGKTGVVYVDKEHDEVLFPKIDTVSFDNICENPEGTDELRKCSNVVVAVKAGAHNGKQLERLLEQCGRQNITIDAVMLTDEDKKLIDKYYRG